MLEKAESKRATVELSGGRANVGLVALDLRSSWRVGEKRVDRKTKSPLVPNDSEKKRNLEYLVRL